MINLPYNAGTEISVEDVIEIFEHGDTHYTLGMYAYYYDRTAGIMAVSPAVIHGRHTVNNRQPVSA